MSYGYMGRILEIDLTKKRYEIGALPERLISLFIGGAGLNARILFDAVYPSIDPLGPDNPLLIGAGPIVGTPFPTGARSTITSVSPLTGIFGDSNGGGIVGVTMKGAGIDHIVIRGQSEQPSCLVISPGPVCLFENASHLWGCTTDETISFLRKKYSKAAFLVIGPAGENLVKYASVFSNKGANFARAGMGTVMGSKRLKAVVVLGDSRPKIHDANGLSNYSKKILRQLKTYGFPRLFKKYGTSMFLNIVTSMGLMYGENWRRRIPYKDIDGITVHDFLTKAESRPQACFRCPLACRRKWKIKEGLFTGEQGHGFDVAHLMSFGLSLGVRDITGILHLIRSANSYGLDINESCGSIGMAIDAYQNDIVSSDDTDGLKLSFGDVKTIDKLLKMISDRVGFGDILAEGTRGAAERIGTGAKDYALHMKGMHWPAHSAPPFALAFSVSTRGGDFLKGVPYILLQSASRKLLDEMFGGTKKTKDILCHEDKGRAVWWHENYKMINDGLGTCFYLSMALLQYGSLRFDGLAKLYSLTTGKQTSGLDMHITGERGVQVERAVNSLLGQGRIVDGFTKRPEPDSWAAGIDLNKMGMLDEYYCYRGLTVKGDATDRRLNELSMGDVAKKLRENGRLSEDTDDNYLSVYALVKDPPEHDRPRNIANKIKIFMERKFMDSFISDFKRFSQHFEKRFRKRQV